MGRPLCNTRCSYNHILIDEETHSYSDRYDPRIADYATNLIGGIIV